MQFNRRFLLPLCAAVTEGDKTGDVIRLSQDGYGSQVRNPRLQRRVLQRSVVVACSIGDDQPNRPISAPATSSTTSQLPASMSKSRRSRPEKSVVDRHRGEDEAKPHKDGGGDTVPQRHLADAEMAKKPCKHPRDDNVHNKGKKIRTKGGNGHLAQRRCIRLSQAHIPERACEPCGDRGHNDGQMINAGKYHDVPLIGLQNRSLPHRPKIADPYTTAPS
jgi:hypothetical protein